MNDHSCSFEPPTNSLRVKIIFRVGSTQSTFAETNVDCVDPTLQTVQYPGEFVPTILWVSGFGAGWFAAQEARRRVAPTA
jgi:hypothetical protein